MKTKRWADIKDKKPVAPDRTAQDAVNINSGNLQDDFLKLPGDHAYWGEKYAQSLGRALRAKAIRKRTFADKFLAIKATPLANDKAPSEKVCEMLVEQDAEYREAVDDEIDAEVEKARCGAIVDAIEAKRDALVSLGANQRAEWRPTTVREQPNDD